VILLNNKRYVQRFLEKVNRNLDARKLFMFITNDTNESLFNAMNLVPNLFD